MAEGDLVRARRADGTEIDLKARRNRQPRELSPFERGFHEAVVGKAREENPYPVCTAAEAEWANGWDLYMERKRRLRWIDPTRPGPTDEAAGITFLCLVEDVDGYYLHKPCHTEGMKMAGIALWHTYDDSDFRRVVEFAWVPMENPAQVDAMDPSHRLVEASERNRKLP